MAKKCFVKITIVCDDPIGGEIGSPGPNGLCPVDVKVTLKVTGKCLCRDNHDTELEIDSFTWNKGGFGGPPCENNQILGGFNCVLWHETDEPCQKSYDWESPDDFCTGDYYNEFKKTLGFEIDPPKPRGLPNDFCTAINSRFVSRKIHNFLYHELKDLQDNHPNHPLLQCNEEEETPEERAEKEQALEAVFGSDITISTRQ